MTIIDNTHYHTLITIDDNDTMQIECTSKKDTKTTFTYVFKFNKKRLQNIIELSEYGFQILLEIFKDKSLVQRLNLDKKQQQTLDLFIKNFEICQKQTSSTQLDLLNPTGQTSTFPTM
ncbi:MAG: hypothetical protein [Microviridae sp.]|nr:MAG: hypothetical protein [Microviridae sp.]